MMPRSVPGHWVCSKYRLPRPWATAPSGWALALDKPIFCKEKAADFTLGLFCKQVVAPEQVRDILLQSKRAPLESLSPRFEDS